MNTLSLSPSLFAAVDDGERGRVHALLVAGADPNAVGEQGETALMRAVTLAEPRIVELLLQYGADPNAERVDGEGPLSLAARVHAPFVLSTLADAPVDDHEPCIRLLARYGADVARQGPPAAFHGITWGAPGTLTALEEAGLDWQAPLPEDRNTPNAPRLVDRMLAMATSLTIPVPEILRFCLARGADANRNWGDGRTSLITLVTHNIVDPAPIQAGVDLDRQDDEEEGFEEAD